MFTKGPWSVFNKDQTICIEPRSVATGRRPCVVDWPGFDSNDMPKSENIANAHLIAASPDLYEALMLLYDHSRLYMVLADNVIRDVESALAKAEGKS